MKKLILLTFVLLLCAGGYAKEFVWFQAGRPITYTISKRTSTVVETALDMFCQDMEQVTGTEPQRLSGSSATIEIVQLDCDPSKERALRGMGVEVDSLKGRKEAFYIAVKGNRLLVVGSDGRGTAYGILELSRLAGVSPWVWWGDVTPHKQTRLTLPSDYHTMQSPSVEYRGVFINDEDWSTQQWSWRHFEPTQTAGRIGTRTYRELFKLLLRLRANTIWPAMHESTTPFYMVEGAKEAADSCGIVIGTSHCEPLMRNNAGEWDKSQRGDFNYITNREEVQHYWIERLQEAGQYENIYTIGMRGVHDSGMEGVTTLEEKTQALQQVIDDQREMLAKYVKPSVTAIPQVFVPYKEVLQIMENGLRLEDDITLMWCDDNYGYITRLSDKEQQKRSGGAGVYYHLSYWGRPHDYLWLTTTQPGLIYSQMRQAYNANARRVWIANVHDPKTAAYDLELFLDLAWSIESVAPNEINDHLRSWLCREFGSEAGQMLLSAMLEFYRLCAIRKPEFMGWNQVELDRRVYIRGWSAVQNTEFSLTEFGGELDRYLESYEQVKQTLLGAEKFVAESRHDAFFAQVKYPVFGAAAMSQKLLEAQRARMLATGGRLDATRWQEDEELMTACAKSMSAFQQIRQMTDYYNNELCSGKWKHSMCYNPRGLYVFYAPNLPIAPTQSEIESYASRPNRGSEPLELDNFIVFNGCDYSGSTAQLTPIQALGHSMNAVPLPKGESIYFEFESKWEGDALLRMAVIPTHPHDTGDVRYSVQIDDEQPQVCSIREGFRTEAWKQNVLRGQALRQTNHIMTRGKHRLTVTALDDNVIVDQLMIDFKPQRKFYMFPITVDYN